MNPEFKKKFNKNIYKKCLINNKIKTIDRYVKIQSNKPNSNINFILL